MTTFRWDFGDGRGPNPHPDFQYDASANHYFYSLDGPFTVSVQATNGFGSTSATVLVPVRARDAVCPAHPPSHVRIDYSGATSGCSGSNGNSGSPNTPCLAGEEIAFVTTVWNRFQECNRFAYDFGDGQTSVISPGEQPLNVTYAEPGEYTLSVVASNGYGEESATLPLRLLSNDSACVAPLIDRIRADIFVGVARSARLSVESSGTAPLIVTWYQLLGSGANQTQRAVGSGLTIQTEPLHSDARFFVNVENACGNARSDIFTVKVKRLRPIGR